MFTIEGIYLLRLDFTILFLQTLMSAQPTMVDVSTSVPIMKGISPVLVSLVTS